MSTPIMTKHARERCAEMGISTKIAKYIVRHADLTRDAVQPKKIAVCDQYPDYAVVYDTASDPPLIITVVFRTDETYCRAGQTWRTA